jgi:acyl-coenzyme A synthetase/AMP-(fatty) acid ligase
MAFLPPEKALEKTGSIGKEIPNGKLFLIDDNGNKIANRNAAGELVYEGPNVTMGYAYTLNDLVKGDENKGRLQTGDIAERDEDGFYYIIGRKQRFLKLYGVRISLDETEHLVKSAFDIDCACIGNDEKMTVIITSEHLKDSVHNYLIEKTGLYHKAIEMEIRDELPKNEAGKTIYT